MSKDWAVHRLAVIGFFVLFLCIGCSRKEEAAPSKNKAATARAPTVSVVSTYPKDSGTLRQLDHPLYVMFSAPLRPKQLTVSLVPDCGRLNRHWQKRGRQVMIEHARPFVPGQQYTLFLTLHPAGNKKQIRFTTFGPSSLVLIDDAQQRGSIDKNTAWILRFQRLFEPDKLPERFRSPTPLPDGDEIVRRYIQVRSGLDSVVVRQLDRYIKRPEDPESFFSRQSAGAVQSRGILQLGPRQAFAARRTDRPILLFHTDCSSAPVRVWAPKHRKADAIRAKEKIDGRDIYNTFKKLLGRVPLDDSSDHPNGGDGRLDIYMLPTGQVGQDISGVCIATGSGRQGPAYIFINRNLVGDDLTTTLAHEIFHAFQYSFDVFEDLWWMEGTAVWSEDLIVKDWNGEWDYLDEVFLRPKFRMEPITENESLHEYGIYLFPYYLSQQHGKQIIADIWKQCVDKRSLDAINAVLDFDDAFKEFALFNMDYGAYEGKYKDANGPLRLFEYHDVKDIYLDSTDKKLLDEGRHETITLPSLGAVYVEVYNLLEAGKTPLVRFNLKQFAKNKDLTVQALINPGIDDRYEDWTGAEEKEFCINRDGESFTSIILVIANKHHRFVFEPELVMKVDAYGCTEKSGSATVTATLSETSATNREYHWPNGDIDRNQSKETSRIEATVQLDLELEDASIEQVTNSKTEIYSVRHASIKSFTQSSHASSTDYSYSAEGHCGTDHRIHTQSLPPVTPKLEYDHSLAITYDLNTGHAQWVTLPVLAIRFKGREKKEVRITGCGNDSQETRILNISDVQFPLGPQNAPTSEEVAVTAKPELREIKQIAKEMQSLAGKVQGMNYKEMEKFVEAFEKRHDMEKLASAMVKKVVSPDLKVQGGDGKKYLRGGGSKSEQTDIPNGHRQTRYELKWQIHLRGETGGN